jgi:hypothetical protein
MFQMEDMNLFENITIET